MFKVGDTVMVRYHSQEEKDNYESNWDTNRSYWHQHMDKMEGKLYQISEIMEPGYRIHDDDGKWRFAEHSLVTPYEQF